MIKNNRTLKLKKCPSEGFPIFGNYSMIVSHSSKAASIHFHHLPMQYATNVITTTPEDIGIYFKKGKRAQFCSFNLRKQKYLYHNICNIDLQETEV